MRVDYDDFHQCPACGSRWKIPVAFPDKANGRGIDDAGWYVPEGTGWCDNSECPMTEAERDAYRAERRAKGWDPSAPAH